MDVFKFVKGTLTVDCVDNETGAKTQEYLWCVDGSWRGE